MKKSFNYSIEKCGELCSPIKLRSNIESIIKHSAIVIITNEFGSGKIGIFTAKKYNMFHIQVSQKLIRN